MHTALWKIGGSLFDLPDLSARVTTLLSQHRDCRVLLLPGGGPTAELVREWQQRTGIDDETAHCLAIRAMDFNAHLIAAILPGGEIVESQEAAEDCWDSGEQPILSPTRLVRMGEWKHPRTALPHNWRVTSDTLAVWIAAHWPCDEVVLLKSQSLPDGISAEMAAECGLVDAYFPQICDLVPRIQWCNLRSLQSPASSEMPGFCLSFGPQ